MRQTIIAGIIREQWDDAAQVYTAYDATGVRTISRPYTAAEVTTAQQVAAQAALDTTRVSLDSKVRAAVKVGGTLDVDLGTTDTKWTPGTPLTLRGLKALTKADLQTATYGSLPAPLAELLAKLAPLLVDMAVAERRVGKLTVQVYNDAS